MPYGTFSIIIGIIGLSFAALCHRLERWRIFPRPDLLIWSNEFTVYLT
jgi:hypothetical protein